MYTAADYHIPPFNSSSVTFPADITLSTCDLGKATPDFLNSKPIVSNLGCRDIGISFYDQVFRDVPGACIKVIRTWKVIDWCSYAANPVVVEQSQKSFDWYRTCDIYRM